MIAHMSDDTTVDEIPETDEEREAREAREAENARQAALDGVRQVAGAIEPVQANLDRLAEQMAEAKAEAKSAGWSAKDIAAAARGE